MESNDLSKEENNKHDAETKTFKIKNTQGKVVYDHATKQRRFMSPFEQFLAE
jgi:hypothetical protein